MPTRRNPFAFVVPELRGLLISREVRHIESDDRALGASAPQLFRMVLLDGMRPVIIGGAFGFAGAYSASRLIRSLLFGTAPADPPTYLTTVLILATVCLCACAIPALKAIHLDPIASLRRQ